ncbi:hypothetical protein EJ06DRAFT_533533 [Trichodelitschia bisporula]|uniref:IGFBP N-terminal domain-containing protein n=1 Tax=Trichodelitschia bisporula TaxID=703511 RepID=A0A6G1HLR0_9PEZI|nr:hypothetical protein EJ06DRAFT_533533 [Trichodelitschia bisporula]
MLVLTTTLFLLPLLATASLAPTPPQLDPPGSIETGNFCGFKNPCQPGWTCKSSLAMPDCAGLVGVCPSGRCMRPARAANSRPPFRPGLPGLDERGVGEGAQEKEQEPSAPLPTPSRWDTPGFLQDAFCGSQRPPCGRSQVGGRYEGDEQRAPAPEPATLAKRAAAARPTPPPLDPEASIEGPPCGFKTMPCQPGWTCKKLDESCTRGENCAGVCTRKAAAAANGRPPFRPGPPGLDAPVTSTKPSATRRPSPARPAATRPSYKSCGGFRIRNEPCAAGEICVDDPYAGGCGMACDAPGVCVKPVFCGGFAGFQCAGGLMCVDDPRDDCDPRNGGSDCGGICV